MSRFLLTVCLSFGVLSFGCQPVSPPDEPTARPEAEAPEATETTPADTEPAPDVETGVDPAPPGPSTAESKYSAEQVAAARQMAADLGVVLKEDGDGHVILVDTAAKRSWVDDYQMQEILVFPHLQTLTVEGPSITDQLAPKIAEAEKLTSLAMRNTLIDDSGLALLSGLKSLKVIDLRVSPLVTDAAMETLASMPELRAVRLSGVNVTDAGIATLLALPQVTELDIRNCRGVTKAGIEQIGQKTTLRVLKIGGPKIDDEILQLVADMEHLKGLSLDNCSITDAGIATLDRIPLEDLTVFQCANITDEGLEVLATYDQLSRLTLRDVGAKGTALAKLPQPETLVSLTLAQSRVSDAEVPLFERFTKLEDLNLSETELTDASVDALSKLTWLKELVLTQTSISEEGEARLRQALPGVTIQTN